MAKKQDITVNGIHGRDEGKSYKIGEIDVWDNLTIGSLLAHALIPARKIEVDGNVRVFDIPEAYQSLHGVTEYLRMSDYQSEDGALISPRRSLYTSEKQGVIDDARKQLIQKSLKSFVFNGQEFQAFPQGYETGAVEEKETIELLFFRILDLHSINFDPFQAAEND
jgi:hypothetical protein